MNEEDGYTPLLSSIESGHINIVRYLIEERKVDPNQVNEFDGFTPLFVCA